MFSRITLLLNHGVAAKSYAKAWISPSTTHRQPSRTISTSAGTRSRSSNRSPQTQRFVATVATEVEDDSQKVINLHSIQKEELEVIFKSWGYPKYRADQVWKWVREQGVDDIDEMNNIPKKLRADLKKFARVSSLELAYEMVSKDGTRKRAYRLWDGQLIESVLMPYDDGRYTACISSQVGCAQGCVFCATGQGGLARQLSDSEIFEQVSRFSAELAKDNDGTKKNGRQKRLSNIVFMGMGEPLANYRNVKSAVNRIQNDIGIGARRITISTVGVVPNIRKLMVDLPQVRLAVSLHCADEEERTALIPVNKKYGGLKELMTTLREYIETTKRRVTLEWALIDGENDKEETAHSLGKLIRKYGIRPDMIHVNVIPLNPTDGYAANPSGRVRVNAFIDILQKVYGITCTPRVRRGIDIDGGCGQLKADIELKERREAKTMAPTTITAAVDATPSIVEKEPGLKEFMPSQASSAAAEGGAPIVGVYEDDLDFDDDDDDDDNHDDVLVEDTDRETKFEMSEFVLDDDAVDFEEDDWEDHIYSSDEEKDEATRLLNLVKGTVLTSDNSVITSNDEYKRND